MSTFSASFGESFSSVALPSTAMAVRQRGMLLIEPMPIDETNLLYSNIPENDAVAWIPGAYGLGEAVVDSHTVYRSLQTNNTNIVTNKEAWQVVGRTNRYKMFDRELFSQSVKDGPIAVVILADRICDSLVITGATASGIEVSVYNRAGVKVGYVKALMSVRSGPGSFHRWFFGRNATNRELHIPGLQIFPGYRVEVVVSGGRVQVSSLFIGRSIELGDIKFGFGARLRSYSAQVEDEFGNVTITPRPASRSQNYILQLPRKRFDEVHRLFQEYESQFAIWVGPADLTTTIVAGIYEDFELVMEYPQLAVCSLKLKGTTG
ncbi:hypothetical protein [Methylobacillus flagellatus]|uniref:hypothetical protein n=1 Tax=Methylobacillus flagellatus TaxID=405 RepID=UPI0010F86F65|nr:hypothetical protein [Methylobacillus flagellatus]